MKLSAFITDMRLLYKEGEKEEKVDGGNLPVNVPVSSARCCMSTGIIVVSPILHWYKSSQEQAREFCTKLPGISNVDMARLVLEDKA